MCVLSAKSLTDCKRALIVLTYWAFSIVDQLIYKLAKDDREQLRAFVYTSLKSMEASPLPAERKLYGSTNA